MFPQDFLDGSCFILSCFPKLSFVLASENCNFIWLGGRSITTNCLMDTCYLIPDPGIVFQSWEFIGSDHTHSLHTGNVTSLFTIVEILKILIQNFYLIKIQTIVFLTFYCIIFHPFFCLILTISTIFSTFLF